MKRPKANCPYCDGTGETGGIDSRTCSCVRDYRQERAEEDEKLVNVYKNITSYPEKKQHEILHGICAMIYVARNISMDEECILRQLRKIDRLFRDDENFN